MWRAEGRHIPPPAPTSPKTPIFAIMPDLTKILFLDIETVSAEAAFEDLSEAFQALWTRKASHVLRKREEELEEGEAAAAYEDRAGIFAEFGRIVCISVGILRRDEEKRLHLRLKSFASEDEAALLKDFKHLLDKHYADTRYTGLCGHNIKEFDIPYICRRMWVNQMPLPLALDLSGKKPWETKHLIDTLEMWKFGDRKNYTSLKLLAALFGIPSPKDDIDGSEVGRVYWKEKDLARIARYCEKDVLATVQLYLRYHFQPLLEEDQITIVE